MNIQNLIMSVNPITESFGNATTCRNNNSSRFGKMIDLLYTPDGYINGARISTYLLETVRVTFQHPGERNYRIFYEIEAGLSADKKEEYHLGNLDDYNYINHPARTVQTDQHNFQLLLVALRQIQFREDEIEAIFRVVVGILHLGNISFDNSSESGSEAAEYSPSCRLSLQYSLELLGCSFDSLYSALTRRHYSITNTQAVQKILNVTSASTARDALARTIYEVLFTRIIDKINGVLNPDENVPDDLASSISVLDVFGFEYYEENSFEQLW